VLAFPPAFAVAVWVDGHPVTTYRRAYISGGRVFAAVSPLLTQLVDRIWFENDELVFERAGRRVRVRVGRPEELSSTFVPLAAVLPGLGDSLRYDKAADRVEIRTTPAVIVSPTPYNPSAPSVEPTTVFTPAPIPTPRPVWSGSPLPRRTPLPLPPP
jgi:hypothetical protein